MFKSIIRRVGNWWNRTFNARLFVVEARAARQHSYIKALEQQLDRVGIASDGKLMIADDNAEFPWLVQSWTAADNAEILKDTDEWPEVIGE